MKEMTDDDDGVDSKLLVLEMIEYWGFRKKDSDSTTYK